MRVLAVLIAATTIYLGAHDVALAQQTVPSITPPLNGLGSTPVTSTVTNCMMSCNSQAANCQTSCLIPAAPTLNATKNTSYPVGYSETDQTVRRRIAANIAKLPELLRKT